MTQGRFVIGFLEMVKEVDRAFLKVEKMPVFSGDGHFPNGSREISCLPPTEAMTREQKDLADLLLVFKVKGGVRRRIEFDKELHLIDVPSEYTIISFARDELEFAGQQHEPLHPKPKEGEKEHPEDKARKSLDLSPIYFNFENLPKDITRLIEEHGTFTLPQLVKYYRRTNQISQKQYERTMDYLQKKNSDYFYQRNP